MIIIPNTYIWNYLRIIKAVVPNGQKRHFNNFPGENKNSENRISI